MHTATGRPVSAPPAAPSLKWLCWGSEGRLHQQGVFFLEGMLFCYLLFLEGMPRRCVYQEGVFLHKVFFQQGMFFMEGMFILEGVFFVEGVFFLEVVSCQQMVP